MHASTTAKTIFRNLTISGIFPCEIETRLFFGSKRDESASTRQTYPYESVAIIRESYGARNNMKVVDEPLCPIFFYYCLHFIHSVRLLDSLFSDEFVG